MSFCFSFIYLLFPFSSDVFLFLLHTHSFIFHGSFLPTFSSYSPLFFSYSLLLNFLPSLSLLRLSLFTYHIPFISHFLHSFWSSCSLPILCLPAVNLSITLHTLVLPSSSLIEFLWQPVTTQRQVTRYDLLHVPWPRVYCDMTWRDHETDSGTPWLGAFFHNTSPHNLKFKFPVYYFWAAPHPRPEVYWCSRGELKRKSIEFCFPLRSAIDYNSIASYSLTCLS